MSNVCMLTTFDNPYNPFEEFNLWFLFDVEHGYNTCGYLERVANISEDMTQKEYAEENERAIDTIIMSDPFNIYKKIRINETKP